MVFPNGSVNSWRHNDDHLREANRTEECVFWAKESAKTSSFLFGSFFYYFVLLTQPRPQSQQGEYMCFLAVGLEKFGRPKIPVSSCVLCTKKKEEGEIKQQADG